MSRTTTFLLVAVACFALFARPTATRSAPDESRKPADKKTPRLTPLNKQQTVLLDAEGKRLLVKAKVSLRDGLLEMFCCLKQTKEHESVVSVDARAHVIHTGLLAIGAKTGAPVRFRPKYTPPTGDRIDIFVNWKDENGKSHRVDARQWIQHAVRRFYVVKMKVLPADVTIPKEGELRFDRTNEELLWYGHMTVKQRDQLLALSGDKTFRKAIGYFFKQSQRRAMKAEWVFAGSGFYVDEKSGEKSYLAEAGDLICVANFPSAMIDIAIESTATGEQNLMFEAYTEHVPPLGTDVTIELTPAKPRVKSR
ncbi:MAG: hypothetical protein CMJ48_04900 [Planctomycetaceae bacterium]|nr:hypothetical protein [Planctomycetaceae bacterium]